MQKTKTKSRKRRKNWYRMQQQGSNRGHVYTFLERAFQAETEGGQVLEPFPPEDPIVGTPPVQPAPPP